jgi:GR25 family glycosyltransferase involved in LPS biosynthesis
MFVLDAVDYFVILYVQQMNIEPEEKLSTTSVVLLFGCIFTLVIIILILVVILINERNENFSIQNVNRPFKVDRSLSSLNTNRLFNGYEDVDFVCISMEHRKDVYFEKLRNQLLAENLQLTWFPGINGKELNLDDYNLAKRYRDFFENNNKQRLEGKTKTDYRGHLGCTVSHLNVIGNIQNMTVIFEDDAEIVPEFRLKFQSALAAVTKLDPEWEVLLLGWCCNYKDHYYCKENDSEPIHEGGIVKVHYWIGGWAYCVRSKAVAQKILKLFNPMSWHIDLSLADAARSKALKVYACLPTITNHSGWLRISSFDFYQIGDPAFIKSDTNL